MKDLVGNELRLGDKCYYIHNTKNGWNLAIVEIVDFKDKTLIVKFVDVNPSKEYESENYYLVVRSDFKNYQGEIGKFFDWISPYIEKCGDKTFIGYSLYEEYDEPRLYYV